MSIINKLFGGKAEPSPGDALPEEPLSASTPVALPPEPDRATLQAAEASALEEALASSDTAALAKMALQAGSTRTRQRAAEAIDDPEQIRELIRLARKGKDNNVYRILTAKRDTRLQAERAAAQLQADIDAAAAAIARHARQPFDPLYEAAALEFERRWRGLEEQASPEQKRVVAADIASAQQVVAAHHAVLQEAARRRESAATAAAEAEEAARAAALRQAEELSAEAARVEAERAAAQAQAETEAEFSRDAIALLRQTQAALDRGGTARAARLRDTLSSRLAAGPAAALPAWFQRQLERADEQLARFRDWHAYTAGPKRTELIERMRALIGASIAPEQLAQHIRKLQGEWRTLHRGAGDDDDAEATQFRELANQAYEPCKLHFAAQAEQRAENRRQRELILASLAALAEEQAGENADWRLIATRLAQARRDWRQYAPVDNDCVSELQQRFRTAMDVLGERLDAEYARNVAAKRQLIARAEALLALDDVRAAIAGAKELQREWQTIGVVPRKQDNLLWEEFRRHCNAVFERSSQEAASHAAAINANAERATALIAEAGRIATLQGDELRAGLQGVDALLAEFDALDLPRQQARALRQQFRQATDHCADARDRERQRARHQARSAVFEAAAAIRCYAWSRHAGESEQRLAELRAQTEARIAGAASAPRPVRSALEKHWQHVIADTTPPDTAGNEATLRLLCVRAELASDRATPSEDLERRREYQLGRLLQSRNLGVDTAPEDLNQLTLEWLTVGPATPDAEEPLRCRFEQCL